MKKIIILFLIVISFFVGVGKTYAYEDWNFDDYVPYKDFNEFSNQYRNDAKSKFKKAIITFIVAFPFLIFSLFMLVMGLFAFDYSFDFFGITAFISIVCLTSFIVISIIKYKKSIQLINNGQVIRGIPFKYVDITVYKESKAISYGIKLDYKLNENDLFIKEKVYDHIIYKNTTCSLIVDPNDHNNYYIDWDIPDRST
jgi:hypothetical protein